MRKQQQLTTKILLAFSGEETRRTEPQGRSDPWPSSPPVRAPFTPPISPPGPGALLGDGHSAPRRFPHDVTQPPRGRSSLWPLQHGGMLAQFRRGGFVIVRKCRNKYLVKQTLTPAL